MALALHSDAPLSSELLHFTNIVDKLDTPEKVLDALHEAVRGTCHLAVLAAILLPIKMGDVDSLELGKTVFLHKGVPKGFWDEFLELARRHLPAPGMLGYLALGPFTMSEAMKRLELSGTDRWPIELALKYGQRDRLLCPVGGPLGRCLLVEKSPVPHAGGSRPPVHGGVLCGHSPAKTD